MLSECRRGGSRYSSAPSVLQTALASDSPLLRATRVQRLLRACLRFSSTCLKLPFLKPEVHCVRHFDAILSIDCVLLDH